MSEKDEPKPEPDEDDPANSEEFPADDNASALESDEEDAEDIDADV